MLPFALVGLGSVAERTVEDQAVGSAHRQLGKKNKNQVCVPNYSQCDSPASYSGSTTCCDGADLLTTYSCQSLTPTYSQCKPHVVPPPPAGPCQVQGTAPRVCPGGGQRHCVPTHPPTPPQSPMPPARRPTQFNRGCASRPGAVARPAPDNRRPQLHWHTQSGVAAASSTRSRR